MRGLLLGATICSAFVCVFVCLCKVGSSIEHPPLVEWPEGISFMKSDNIQATPSSLFHRSSLTLINEVEVGRGREGGKVVGSVGGWSSEGGWRDSERGRDTNSLSGLLSGSITFGELLSTPVWQLYRRGWKEWRERGGRENKKRSLEKASLSMPCHAFFFFSMRGNWAMERYREGEKHRCKMEWSWAPHTYPTKHVIQLPARPPETHTHFEVSFYRGTRLQCVDTNSHSPPTNGIWHVQSTVLPNRCC